MSAFSVCTRCLRQSAPRVQTISFRRQLHTPASLKQTTATTLLPKPVYHAERASLLQKEFKGAFGKANVPGIHVVQTIPSTSSLLEAYTVQRTPSRNLPIYQLAKAGGNLKLTKVRKLGGDTEALRKELEVFLEPRSEYVKINAVTGHIIIKVRSEAFICCWQISVLTLRINRAGTMSK